MNENENKNVKKREEKSCYRLAVVPFAMWRNGNGRITETGAKLNWMKFMWLKLEMDVVPFVIKLKSTLFHVIAMNNGPCKWCWCRLWFLLHTTDDDWHHQPNVDNFHMCAETSWSHLLSRDRQVAVGRENPNQTNLDNYENKYLVEIAFVSFVIYRPKYGLMLLVMKSDRIYYVRKGSHGFKRESLT